MKRVAAVAVALGRVGDPLPMIRSQARQRTTPWIVGIGIQFDKGAVRKWAGKVTHALGPIHSAAFNMRPPRPRGRFPDIRLETVAQVCEDHTIDVARIAAL